MVGNQKMSYSRTLVCLLVLVGASLSTFSARADDRFALIIGNSAYPGGQALRNPVNDADQVSKSLKSLGFSVDLVKNSSKREMKQAVRRFVEKLGKGKMGLFFFAVHGMQVKGINYLIPIDAEIEKEFDVADACLDIGYILEAMESVNNTLNVLVLDCCRDNRFKRSWTRNNETGLAAIGKVPDGTIIAFSTAPGRTAEDGSGNTSPYVKYFTDSLNERPSDGELFLRDVFTNTAQGLRAATGQRSWANIDLSAPKFDLLKGADVKAPPNVAMTDDQPGVAPSPPPQPKEPPYYVRNLSKVTDATLFVRLPNGQQKRIAPGASEPIEAASKFQYFDGVEWKQATASGSNRSLGFVNATVKGRALWFPESAAPRPQPQPAPTTQGLPAGRPFTGSLAGTKWNVRDSAGDTYQLLFLESGDLHYEAARGPRKNGKWTARGSTIEISINDGYVTMTATLSGRTLNGKSSGGWTWRGAPAN